MEDLILANRKRWILDVAKELDFDLCGIAPADFDPRNREQYVQWLKQGYAGEMGYMKRPERQDLRALLPSVRSVICVGLNYNTAYPLSVDSPDPNRGWIARYAWGDDYHDVLRERLERLVQLLRAEVGKSLEAKIYVDTGPLLERAVAESAGLGWIAKNTCLINEGIGSWFFLGAILTNLELEPDFPAADRCGTCTKCLDACPTGALPEPHGLDATRCISYYTIEVKGSIPEPMRPQIGRHIFGCDICQDVCPWNRKASATPLPAFQPRPLPIPDSHFDGEDSITAFHPPLDRLAQLSEEQFHAILAGSPIRRPKYRGFLRNVAVAMGNSGSARFIPILERLAQHPDPVLSEHAQWALDQVFKEDGSDGEKYGTSADLHLTKTEKAPL